MEWAPQFHGHEGKVHADKRTVEYRGRGNHSADAVSFVGAISVAQALTEQADADARDRAGRAVCLATPLDSIVPTRDSASTTDAAPAPSPNGGEKDEMMRADGKKNKFPSPKKSPASRKKRRVGSKEVNTSSSERDDEAASVLQLPVYYFEVQILATRHFQGDPGDAYAREGDGDDGDDEEDKDNEDEEENGDDDSEMKDEDDDDDEDEESDEVPMGVDLMDPATGEDDALAPWRGRARRLIHEHLRATTDTAVASGSERGSASSGSDAVGHNGARHNGNGSDGTMEIDSITNGDSDSQHRALQQRLNGNGNGTSSRLARSPTGAMSPPSPPQLTNQQLLLSFPLSSSTIHQIRLRLERQHQQAQAHRRRFSSSGSTDSGSVSLTSAISSIHARQRRETARRKRSNHRIAVGFMFCKHGGDYKRDIWHDELGRQACGVAFVGKTGAVLSNGQTFLQTDVRFGHGDTVGCGVILDTRTFFWTVNGRLAATLPVSAVHHLDDCEDHDVNDVKDTEWFMPWANQLLPSVSLHEHGECVRAMFSGTPPERFRFDLDAFKQQQLQHRQTALSAYACSKSQNAPAVHHGEEDIMHKLIEDYFEHFGYGNALSALHNLHQGSHTAKTSRGSESVPLRHTIRQLIYSFKTEEALHHIESNIKQVSAHDTSVLLHCHFLCVVDVLYDGHITRRLGNNTEAIRTAQKILHTYLSEVSEDPERLGEVRAFMSALLYASVEDIPKDCAGRRFLTWAFREEVADALNDAVASSSSEPCALEKLVDDLSDLQRECLTCGASPFPIEESRLLASSFSRGHKHGHDHSKRRSSNMRSADDSDDENDDEVSSSSSNESEDDDDDDDDE